MTDGLSVCFVAGLPSRLGAKEKEYSLFITEIIQMDWQLADSELRTWYDSFLLCMLGCY